MPKRPRDDEGSKSIGHHADNSLTQHDVDYLAAMVKHNKDETGEYRAVKFEKILGAGADDADELVPVLTLPADASIEEMAAILEADGALIVKGAVDVSVVKRIGTLHEALLQQLTPQFQELKAIAAANIKGRAFYSAERVVDELRVRQGSGKGRFDLKSLDRRDGGPLVRQKTEISEAVEGLICPSIVRQLLQRCAGCPWRTVRCGSIVVEPGAEQGDWHRDIGEGLFGEDIDIRLPDYYFNALVPLDDSDHKNGTELVLGSHRVITSDLAAGKLASCRRAVTVAGAGDIVFFNGKLIHRGLPNRCATTRSLLYLVHAAKWFEQGRNPSVEYWTGGGWDDMHCRKSKQYSAKV